MNALGKDLGSRLHSVVAFSHPAAAGDLAATAGLTIDREGLDDWYDSALLLLVAHSTGLTANATLTVTVQMQDSADGSTWANVDDAEEMTVNAGSAATTDVNGLLSVKVPLRKYRRYVRAQVTGALSTDADTFGGDGRAGIGRRRQEPPLLTGPTVNPIGQP